MPLNIGRMDTQINVSPGASDATPDGSATPAVNASANGNLPDSALIARLRPIVTEILEDELARFRRERG